MRPTLISLASALAALPLTVAVPGLLASPSSGVVDKPAAEPTATFAKGVLTVRGTSQDETISLARKGRKVTLKVDGAKVRLPKGYANSKCEEIRILGLAGDDRMTVDSSKGSLPDVVLVGGKGDDTLTGGTRDDVLQGGQGADELRPGDGGNDVLDGGVGADTYLIDADLPGQASILEPSADGPDHVSFAATSRAITVDLSSKTSRPVSSAYSIVLPHLGIEELTGGAGDDILRGRTGPERIHGGSGDDVLTPPIDFVAGDDGNAWYGDEGDDTFEFRTSCVPCHLGSTRVEDSSGNDTVSFAISGGPARLDLGSTTWQAVAASYDLLLAPGSTFENVIAGSSSSELIGTEVGNRLTGGLQSDTLTGNGGADTFVMVANPFAFGSTDDSITDFTAGLDTVDLQGLTITSGLGTSTVNVWDGTRDHGSITASNGHVWTAADFT